MAARSGVQLIHHACFVDDVAMRALEDRRDDVWVCPGLHYVYAMVHGHADPWGMTSDRLERSGYRRELESLVTSLQKLHAAGIRILAGGDFGHQWTHHGTYAAELERYVDLVGMTPVEAIHTATRNTAPLVGLDTGEVPGRPPGRPRRARRRPDGRHPLLQRSDRRRAVMKSGSFVYVNPGLLPQRDPRSRRGVRHDAVRRGGTLGSRGAPAPAFPPPRARPTGRVDHGHHGLGVPGVAARHVRPRARGAEGRARAPPCPAPSRPQRGAGGRHRLGQPDGGGRALPRSRRRRRGLVRKGPGPRPVGRRPEARQRHGFGSERRGAAPLW